MQDNTLNDILSIVSQKRDFLHNRNLEDEEKVAKAFDDLASWIYEEKERSYIWPYEFREALLAYKNSDLRVKETFLDVENRYLLLWEFRDFATLMKLL